MWHRVGAREAAWDFSGCPRIVERAKEGRVSISTLHLKFHEQLVCLGRKEMAPPPHLWASEDVEVDHGAHKEFRGQWRWAVWGCPVASELQDGMPNPAEKYSVWAPREIQMPLWGSVVEALV